jgi:hypothetical protein
MDNSAELASDVNQIQTESFEQAEPEKMLPQSQVNEIVGREKRAAEKRAVENYKRQLAMQEAQSITQSESSYSRPISEDDVKRYAGDEIKRHYEDLQRQAHERATVEAANRVVAKFREKILTGIDKYQDFEQVTDSVKMQHYPNVVHMLAEQVDNTADVLYYLSKNRSKLYQLEKISEDPDRMPDAIYELKRLSDSIKANEQSAQIKDSKAPLSQQRPSTTGTDSGGLSMSDLKRKYRA